MQQKPPGDTPRGFLRLLYSGSKLPESLKLSGS